MLKTKIPLRYFKRPTKRHQLLSHFASSVIWLTFFLLPLFPCFGQSQDWPQSALQDLKILSADSMEGRRFDNEGMQRARGYLKQRMAELNLLALGDSYSHSFELKGKTLGGEGVNFLGLLPGKKDSIILITAHYDHLGMKGETIYNGADDNASGVAALLSLAEYFQGKELEHSLLFAALDGEEIGLQGARELAKDAGLMQKTVFNINMDMLGVSDEKVLYASGSHHHPWIKDLIQPLVENSNHGLLLKLGHDQPNSRKEDWTFSSDHAIFHRQGIPFLYFGVEDHPNYHTPEDTYEIIQEDFFLNTIRVIKKFILLLDESSTRH